MNNLLKIGEFKEYKGFKGTIEYNKELKMHYGYVIGLTENHYYQGKNIEDLYNEFQLTVNNYYIENETNTDIEKGKQQLWSALKTLYDNKYLFCQIYDNMDMFFINDVLKKSNPNEFIKKVNEYNDSKIKQRDMITFVNSEGVEHTVVVLNIKDDNFSVVHKNGEIETIKLNKLDNVKVIEHNTDLNDWLINWLNEN